MTISSPVSVLYLPSLSCFVYPLCFTRDSPYPEVQASVSNTDNPIIPVNTFQVWVHSFWRKPTYSPAVQQVVSWFTSLLGHTCLQHHYSVTMYIVAIPTQTHYAKVPYRSFRHHCPFHPAYNTSNGQVPRMGSSKTSFLHVWLLVFPQPWSIQH